jgi:hypothetical protein
MVHLRAFPDCTQHYTLPLTDAESLATLQDLREEGFVAMTSESGIVAETIVCSYPFPSPCCPEVVEGSTPSWSDKN